MNDNSNEFKSGFIAIAGAPNAGKSTLLNRILGEKISITSRKPQTTRNRILGVCHRPGAQLVFIDTPGVHKTEKVLNVRIVEEALTAIGDVDAIVLVVDVYSPDDISEGFIVEKLEKQKKPVILVLNKIDLVEKQKLLAIIGHWSKVYAFREIIPVSAKHGDQVDFLLDSLEKLMPEGPPYYPEDTLTDVPERFIAAEMIREKVFRLTGQEIPYSTAVVVDMFEDKSKCVEIHATINVERDSQKGMVIGRKGSKLKAIGEESRKDIERMLGTKVFLKLFVRVQKNWSKDTRSLRRFGY